MTNKGQLAILCHSVPPIFDLVKTTFAVQSPVLLDVSSVSLSRDQLTDTSAVAGTTLRKLQALYYCACPGNPTTLGIVVGLAAELERSLVELSEVVDNPEARSTLGKFPSQIFAALTSLVDPNEAVDPATVLE